MVTDLDQLKKVDGASSAVIACDEERASLSNFTIRNVEIVGPKVGAQLRHQAILATLYALMGMLVYIAFRFEWVYGAAAVIAVFHDVLITLGFFSLFHYEISLTVIAALLTLVGLFDERHDRDFRSRARESPPDAARTVHGHREQVHQSDAFPHDFDQRI